MRILPKTLVTAAMVAACMATSSSMALAKAKTAHHCVDSTGTVVAGVFKKKECSAPNKWVRAEPKSPRSASAQAVGTKTTK